MFASMLNDLRQSNANIMVECEQRLISLFQRSFPDIRFFCRTNPPDQQLLNPNIDYQISMGSLGQWLRTDLDSFKQGQSYYLTACPDKTAELRNKYQQLASGRKLVGISWKSTDISQRRAKSKSTSLEYWASVLSQPNCYFINLQYGDIETEVAKLESDTNLKVYQDKEIDPLVNLDGFAAQISALDLVISTSNTTVHMAGALGKRVWTLLPHIPDWRWTLDREDALWYPAMRLFRQSSIGDWQDVFKRVSHALSQSGMV
jgi:ADP-heptose:LPS heptosyltransferase